MLTAEQLAYTRRVALSSLVERAIVQHTTTISDGMGGTLPVLTYTGDIPCRVAPMRVQAAEALVGGQLMGQLPWEITLPAGTVFDVSDRINVGGSLSGTAPNQVIDGGRWFEILAIYGAWTNETARQVLCAERDSG